MAAFSDRLMMMPPHQVIIDCDPGHDDAIAILLALASPELDVLAITTVAGNVPVTRSTANARRIVELAGRPEVAVHAGAAAPLNRPLVTAEHVHGKTGLDGPDLPAPQQAAADGDACDRILAILATAPAGHVTICALAPMTNLAHALARNPEVFGRARQIIAMGGAQVPAGTANAPVEFNIQVDPEAAKAVFSAGIPIVLHSLDSTSKTVATESRIAAIRGLQTPVGTAVADLLSYSNRTLGETSAVHDPNVVAWLLDPALYKTRAAAIRVEVNCPIAIGQTYFDWQGDGAQIVADVNDTAFFGLLLDRLGRL